MCMEGWTLQASCHYSDGRYTIGPVLSEYAATLCSPLPFNGWSNVLAHPPKDTSQSLLRWWSRGGETAVADQNWHRNTGTTGIPTVCTDGAPG